MPRNVMKKYSLKSAYKQKQEIILNYIENISPKKIREILNCSQSHANFLYSNLVESCVDARRRDFCMQVLQLKSQGLSLDEIAKRLNKSKQTIYGYVRFSEEKGLDKLV